VAGVPAPIRPRTHLSTAQADPRLDSPENPHPRRRGPLDLARDRRAHTTAPGTTTRRRPPPALGTPGPARSAHPRPGRQASLPADLRSVHRPFTFAGRTVSRQELPRKGSRDGDDAQPAPASSAGIGLAAVDEQLIDRLASRARAAGLQPARAGCCKALTKRLLESALEGEITDHLGYDRHDPAGWDGVTRATGTERRPCSPTWGVWRSRSDFQYTVPSGHGDARLDLLVGGSVLGTVA
jgi:hypothetical protein